MRAVVRVVVGVVRMIGVGVRARITIIAVRVAVLLVQAASDAVIHGCQHGRAM